MVPNGKASTMGCRSCDHNRHSANEKHMMDTTSNTRVKVPNSLETSTDMQPNGANEAIDPNPPGRPIADVHGSKRSNTTLVSCRKNLNVSTLNVRTLSGNHRKQELAVNFSKYDLDLLGIQEHIIVHQETIRYGSIEGKTLITSSAWRNDRGASTGGVGILLGQQLICRNSLQSKLETDSMPCAMTSHQQKIIKDS